MSGQKNDIEKVKRPPEGLKATLEMKFIEEYLLSKGYRRRDLRRLPKEQARQLLIEASIHASAKLADIEARGRYREMFHRSS